MQHAYPRQLVKFLRERWMTRRPDECGDCPPLPDTELLERLVSTVYQATLLREEERPVIFRLVLDDPSSFPDEGSPPTGLHRLTFEQARPFSEHELRRLSPAAKYSRALIGVRLDPEAGLLIWGMLQSGPGWLQGAQGGRGAQVSMPDTSLVVRAKGPGNLVIARGSHTLGELRAGQINGPWMDVFRAKWLSERFVGVWLGEHLAGATGEPAAGPPPAGVQGARLPPLDPALTRFIAQQMIRRILATMRGAHHGGTVLIMPDEFALSPLSSGHLLQLKYPFERGEPRARYRSLILQMAGALARSASACTPVPPVVDGSLYETARSPELSRLDEAIFEMSHLIAALTEVDGAVVLTKRFELLGFGGEIAGDLEEVSTVRRALDLEAETFESERIDGEGTRHRSAYRLCQQEHDAVAIVASQDGGARFVAFHRGAITYWNHSSSATLDA